MTESFTATETGALARASERPRNVLVTGAAGNIGSYFAEHSHEKYELRLMVQYMDESAEQLRAYGEVVVGDLADLDQMKEYSRGIDTVLHLAANPDPDATWRELLDANITGTYHMMVAARASGCRRL